MPRGDERIRRIQALQAGHTHRAAETEILQILEESSAEVLNYVLAALNLGALFADVDDRAFGPDNRVALVDLLARRRLADLSTASRALLVTALQRARTDRQREQAVRDVFLGTRGAELTELKNRIDGGDDYHDLTQLLFHDLDDLTLRQEILDHIRSEAPASKNVDLKVLSDIDDTLYANWKDERYPKGTVYPGVRQFYEELDCGPAASGGRQGDLAFVTARPGERFGVVENATQNALRERGIVGATVLAGDVTHLTTDSAIAAGKFESFRALRALYPEYAFVFVGDSGQGDVAFGQRMLQDSPPGKVRMVFIHDVVNTPDADREHFRSEGIWFFDTYVGAAADALARSLISKNGALRIAQSAVQEFHGLAFTSDAQRQARWRDLQRDLARLDKHLGR
ncbi:MAG: hypothetical protein HYV63_34345 [Candidatus Schekmanbacteria bacterium]|nr:hypothetical protein [Candidatus Schekmanbacteria bacterium]